MTETKLPASIETICGSKIEENNKPQICGSLPTEHVSKRETISKKTMNSPRRSKRIEKQDHCVKNKATKLTGAKHSKYQR